MVVSNRVIDCVTRPRAKVLLAVAVAVLSFGQGNVGHAQQSSIVPALGVIDSSTADGVDQNEFVLDAPADRIQVVAARHGLTIVRSVDARTHKVFLVTGPGTASAEELATAVAADPDVTHFEKNGIAIHPEVPSGINLDQSPIYVLEALSSDRTFVNFFGAQAWSQYAKQPATTAIRLPQTHQKFVTGAEVVAIIDTGVDPNHPLLRDSLVPGYDFVNETSGEASDWDDLDPTTRALLDQSPIYVLEQASVVSVNQSTVAVLSDTTAASLNTTALPPAFGHGTMVAGLVHLVAPTAKIMPLRVFRADGSSRVFDIARAIYYAVENGARVINMSFSTAELSAEITHAINHATEQGVICVSSAGNSGRDLVVYPAGLRSVAGIGSTNSTEPARRSLFSNYGSSLIEAGAPGEGVITTYPGGHYVGAWGTSFSTGLVSGAVALLLQRDPALGPSRVFDLLEDGDSTSGSGGMKRLNLLEMLEDVTDRIAPTVSLVSPASGTVVGNTVLISASASDNVKVAGVKFLVDNVPLGAEDTTAPFEATWNTAGIANGSHTLTVIARDLAGNATSATLTITTQNDVSAPTVTVSSPATGATVSGPVTLTAAASDDTGVDGVQFLLDGTPLGPMDSDAPYELTWSTLAVANGAHTLTAVARDTAGKETTAASVRVTVANDTTAPLVALTTPVAGATISGTVTVAASATDDGAVTSVQFLLDGAALAAADTQAPYEVSWSTGAVANGPHTITAIARDAAGNEATAANVLLTVANDTAAPTVGLIGPTSGAALSGTVTLVATAADDGSVASVQFLVDGAAFGPVDTDAPYELTWSTLQVPNGAHSLTAVARDAAGNEATGTSVSVTVFNDSTAPTVALTGLAGGATVSGTVTVVASATDDDTVASVQFLLDGAPLGATDTAAPYELAWSTLAVANGAHTLAAVARDATGNEATAAAISVAVSNDTTAPTVVVTGPTIGTIATGTVTLAANATDDGEVAGVQFLLDGVALGATDTAAPYEVAWSSLTATNGAHTLTAVARDTAGNEATAAAVTVTVFNDTTAPTVLVTSPMTGTTATGTVTFAASATDDAAVASVQFLLDGVALGAADTESPTL